MNKRLPAALVALAVLAAGLAFYFSRPHEPSYQGRTFRQWLADMDSNRPEVKEQAHVAMRHLGDPVIPALLQVINEDNVPAGAPGNRAYNALIAMAPDHPAAFSALTNLLYYKATSMDAALSLAALDVPGVAVLTNAAASFNPILKNSAVAALGTCDEFPAVAAPVLISVLDDSERRIRQMAILSLGRIGADQPGVVAAIATRLTDKSAEIRAAAARTLGKFGPKAREAVPALQAAQSDSLGVVRQEATTALEKITGAPGQSPAK